jgi:hypothetical protein
MAGWDSDPVRIDQFRRQVATKMAEPPWNDTYAMDNNEIVSTREAFSIMSKLVKKCHYYYN